MFCGKCGRQIEDGSLFCPYCGATVQQAFAVNPLDDPRGMKWFKFIIYFQLFASAVINVFSSIMVFTGAHYGGNAASVYSYFPGLRIIDIMFGIVCLVLAGFAIYTRQRLAKFFRDGPMLYFVLLGVNIAGSIIYLLSASMATGMPFGQLMTPREIGSDIGYVILLLVNMSYFNKRADLFVN